MTTCTYREKIDEDFYICKLADMKVKLLGSKQPVRCRDDAFKKCSECDCPHTENYISMSLMLSNVLDNCNQEIIKQVMDEVEPIIESGKLCELPGPDSENGPGTILHDIVKRHGYDIEAGCNCIGMIRRMNRRSTKWCRDNAKGIADYMVEEAKKRKIKIMGIVVPELALRYKALHWIEEACNIWDQQCQNQST